LLYSYVFNINLDTCKNADTTSSNSLEIVTRSELEKINIPEYKPDYLNQSSKPIESTRKSLEFLSLNENLVLEKEIPEHSEIKEEEDKKTNYLEKKFSSLKLSELKLTPIIFEKDDDTNHHVDFIACLTSLRCINYSIKDVVSKDEVKRISGF
jgi:hypothetical protein